MGAGGAQPPAVSRLEAAQEHRAFLGPCPNVGGSQRGTGDDDLNKVLACK
jgi:hypothetical protein